MQLKSILIAAIILTVVSGGAVVAHQQLTNSAPTKPPLTFKPAPRYKHTDKVRGSIDVQLLSSEDKSYEVGDVFSLRAVVTAGPETHDLEYEWNLPAGVELIAGVKTGALGAGAEEPIFVDISLRQLSDNNEQIHFILKAKEGVAQIGQSAQFNTQRRRLEKSATLPTENESAPSENQKLFQ